LLLGLRTLINGNETYCTDTSLGYGSDSKWLGKYVKAAQDTKNGLLVLSSEAGAIASRCSEMEIRHVMDKGVRVYLMYPSGQKVRMT